MATIITGLFQSQSQSRKISEDLENAGFAQDDFIIYLQDREISREVKTSVWQSFFKDNRTLEDESLVVTVRVRDPESRERILQIFSANGAVHTNYFENIKFRDAMSLQFLKRIVALRAKSQIASPREVRHHGQSGGMSSEITFGKS